MMLMEINILVIWCKRNQCSNETEELANEFIIPVIPEEPTENQGKMIIAEMTQNVEATIVTGENVEMKDEEDDDYEWPTLQIRH